MGNLSYERVPLWFLLRNDEARYDGMMTSVKLYAFVLGFIGGVLFRSFFNLGFAFLGFLALLGFALFSQGKFFSHSAEGEKMMLAALFLFASTLGIVRYEFKEMNLARLPSTALNREGEFRGIVTSDTDLREKNVRAFLKLTHADGEKLVPPARALLVAPLYVPFEYGDVLYAKGKLVFPKNFESDTDRVFDYVSYLGKDDISYILEARSITAEKKREGNPAVGKLLSFKHAFMKNIGEVMKEPEASLLGGILLGIKQSLGKELLDAFRTVGIIHIIVLSGYNITIVASFFMKLFSRLPRMWKYIAGAAAIILFVVMTGGSATSIRAAIMALLVILGRVTYRTYNVTRGLILAAFLMILANPKVLVFDPSFQLSFLATVGLIYVSPLIIPKLLFVTEKFKLREIVVSTLATQIFVLPALIYMTGQVSVVALLVNLLVLPVIPPAMLLGFLGGLFGFIHHALAFPFAAATSLLLSYVLKITEFFSSLSFAAFRVSNVSVVAVLILYALLTTALAYKYHALGGFDKALKKT